MVCLTDICLISESSPLFSVIWFSAQRSGHSNAQEPGRKPCNKWYSWKQSPCLLLCFSETWRERGRERDLGPHMLLTEEQHSLPTVSLCSRVMVFYNNIFLVRNRENHPNHVPEVDCFTNLAPRGETTKTAIWKKCHLPFSKSVQQKIKRLAIQGQWPRVGEVNLTMWLHLKNMSKARESEICSNVYLTPKLLSPRVRLLLLWASTS